MLQRDDSEIKAWDLEFVKVDQSTLFELILAANYLNIKKLLDLCCMTVANMIKGKSPEEIRKVGTLDTLSPPLAASCLPAPQTVGGARRQGGATGLKNGGDGSEGREGLARWPV